MSDPNPNIDEILEDNRRLKRENGQLSNTVKSFKESRANWWQIRFWAGKKIGEIFLGWRLSGSIKDLVRELGEGKVKNETIGNVLTHILWRFTRVGVIAVLLAIIPSAILIIQTMLLSNQNELLDIQNERVTQQNLLIEAQRRSSYVFMLGNLMDAINTELNNPTNIKRDISPQLLGQIVSLSSSLIPYQFMQGDSLIKTPLSPERGMLLVFLLESKINSNNLNYILTNSTFTNSYAENLLIFNDTINTLNVSHSMFGIVKLNKSRVNTLDCFMCKVNRFDFGEGQYANIRFQHMDTVAQITFNNSHLLETHLSADHFEIIKVNKSQWHGIEFMANTINRFEFDKCKVSMLNIEADTLRSLFFNETVLWGRNSYNSTKGNHQWKTILNIFRRNENDFRKGYLEKLGLLNSFIVDFGTLSKIDEIQMRWSIWFNPSPKEIDISITMNYEPQLLDISHAIGEASFVSSNLIHNKKSRLLKDIILLGENANFIALSSSLTDRSLLDVEAYYTNFDYLSLIKPDWR